MDQNNNQNIRGPAARERRKRLRWGLLSALIAAFTIWAVTSQFSGFSLRALLNCLADAKPLWMVLAFLSMLGFIFFEGCALRCACRALQYPTSLRTGFGYAATDIFFSAITPSATGGQPACALMMMRSGIPGCVAAAVLMLTLTMYTVSIIVVGLLCTLLAPSVFFSFGSFAQALIVVGLALQLILTVSFVLLMRSAEPLKRIGVFFLRVLHRLHLLRNLESKQARLELTLTEYRRRAVLLTGHRRLLLRSFLFNLLQRVSQILVSVFVFLAMGGPPREAFNIFAVQSYVVIGSNSIPIPGAMGVADFLMLDGFQAFLRPDQLVNMELISRSVSFYSCVLLCGILVLISSYRNRKVDRS